MSKEQRQKQRPFSGYKAVNDQHDKWYLVHLESNEISQAFDGPFQAIDAHKFSKLKMKPFTGTISPTNSIETK